QYLSDKKDFSEISFKGYNIALNKLTEQAENRDNLAESTSWDLVSGAMARGEWTPDTVKRLISRLSEGLRAISMVVFVGALAFMPHARRGRARVPMELVPLAVAYADKTIGGYIGGPPVV